MFTGDVLKSCVLMSLVFTALAGVGKLGKVW